MTASQHDSWLTGGERTGDGLKVYDITLGSGEEVVKGTKVKARTSCRRTKPPFRCSGCHLLEALATRIEKESCSLEVRSSSLKLPGLLELVQSLVLRRARSARQQAAQARLPSA